MEIKQAWRNLRNITLINSDMAERAKLILPNIVPQCTSKTRPQILCLTMPADDLKNYYSSEVDFYELLGVSYEASTKELDRSWRRTALKYHPDKVGDDPIAKEKFHLAQVGYDLLSDPQSRALYHRAWEGRLLRKRQNELLKGKRLDLKHDLEARERGFKRPREEDEGAEEKLEREIRRLAEDGKRRRKEREDALRKDIEKEADGVGDGVQTPGSENVSGSGIAPLQSGVSDLDRTIKVRFPVDGDGGSMTSDRVKSLFSKFGVIESADLLNPKMLRLGKKQKKQLAIVCMIQYKSVVGAHAAVEDFGKQEGPAWQLFDSVFWAANKEPEFMNSQNTNPTPANSAPSTPIPKKSARQWTPDSTSSNRSSTPKFSPQVSDDGLKKKPSFASFSPAAFNTPKGSPFGKGLGANSPSLEEMTMIRLKNAEKRRLAAEIEKKDAEEDAAARA